jgi:arsenical pump membrane protein
VHEHDTKVDLGELTRLGLLAMPATLVLVVVALWSSLAAISG